MIINVSGENERQKAADLIKWLRHEEIPQTIFEQKRDTHLDGSMGADFLPMITAITPIITAAAGSPVIVQILKSIQSWIISRRPKVVIELTAPDGISIKIDAENIKGVDDIIERAAAKLRAK